MLCRMKWEDESTEFAFRYNLGVDGIVFVTDLNPFVSDLKPSNVIIA